MRNLRSRLEKIEVSLAPRSTRWRSAVRVMANETTTDAEVNLLLEREGVDLTPDGPWIIIRRLISPGRGDALPGVPYVARAGGLA